MGEMIRCVDIVTKTLSKLKVDEESTEGREDSTKIRTPSPLEEQSRQ